MPHRGQQRPDPDPVSGLAGAPLALAEALAHRLDDLLQGQPRGQVLLGGVPHLGVDDAVGRQVLGALGGDSDQRVPGLHHADRVRERLQIPLQRAGVGRLPKPRAQLLRARLRQSRIPALAGQVHDRGRPQAAVQMVVQQRLGCPANLIRGGEHRIGFHRHRDILRA
jgi:hypothetical protein